VCTRNPLCLSFCGSIIKKNVTVQFRAKDTMGLSESEQQKEQGHDDDDDDNDNILTKEVDSWNNFEYALREENRLLFNKMVSECRENEDYATAASSKDEYFSAESLFMVLILQQQKMYLVYVRCLEFLYLML
jgi:hypothetical protein